MRVKPIVAIDLSSTGAGGGPYISNLRVMNSRLNEKYEFRPFIYRTEIGRFISIKRILDLSNQLKTIKPDMVHFSGLQLMGLHLAIACRLAGIKKSVVIVHGLTGDALNIGWFKKTLMTFILEPLTIMLAKKTYGVSEFVSNRTMLKLFKRKNCGYVYNIPANPIQDDFHISIKNELKIDPTAKIAVTVGHVNKDKGFHILDEAILRCAEINDLKFIIIGEGDYLEQMKNKLNLQVNQKQVFFTGYRRDVQQILKDCAFFILPTLHETLSIALLEASTEGLPLIASNTGGVPEIVIDGYNGILVTPRSVDELHSAIIKLYNNHALCKIYGENARRQINEKFNIQKIEARIDQIYQAVLKED
jgi:glycosyltransferase involved in cell wall biosynthesis